MIIYAKSFSKLSVCISHDTTGLSQFVIVVFPGHTLLLILTRRFFFNFFLYMHRKNSPTPIGARYFHQFK